MPNSDPVLAARSRVGNAARVNDPQRLLTARQDLAAAHVERAITAAEPPLTTDHRADLIVRLVEQAPPLTDEQTDRIVSVLRGGQR